MDSPTRDDALRAFFARYGGSLERFAAEEVADCYALPCLVLADEGEMPLTERRSLVDAFSGAGGRYRQHGFARAIPRNTGANAAAGRIVTADVNWAYRDAADRALYACDFRYLPRADAGDWRIRVVIAIDEAQRLAAFLGDG